MHTAQKAILEHARDLRALNASTEQDFLSLGHSLGKVSSEAQKISTLAASVVELCGCLSPRGYLFMGHSETLLGVDVPLVQTAPTVYRRLT